MIELQITVYFSITVHRLFIGLLYHTDYRWQDSKDNRIQVPGPTIRLRVPDYSIRLQYRMIVTTMRLRNQYRCQVQHQITRQEGWTVLQGHCGSLRWGHHPTTPNSRHHHVTTFFLSSLPFSFLLINSYALTSLSLFIQARK